MSSANLHITDRHKSMVEVYMPMYVFGANAGLVLWMILKAVANGPLSIATDVALAAASLVAFYGSFKLAERAGYLSISSELDIQKQKVALSALIGAALAPVIAVAGAGLGPSLVQSVSISTAVFGLAAVVVEVAVIHGGYQAAQPGVES